MIHLIGKFKVNKDMDFEEIKRVNREEIDKINLAKMELWIISMEKTIRDAKLEHTRCIEERAYMRRVSRGCFDLYYYDSSNDFL